MSGMNVLIPCRCCWSTRT